MLKQSLTYHLTVIAEDAIGAAAELFDRRFGFSVHALRVLRLIGDDPGITFTQLAERTKFERSATSRLLSQLIKAGLVRRRNSALDARRFELYISAKGQELRRRADPLSLEIEALILSPLSEKEKALFIATIERITAWVAGDFLEIMATRYPDSPSAEIADAARARKRTKPQS